MIMVTFLILTMLTIGGESLYYGFALERDIDAWIDRAQVAGDRQDMVQYLEQAQLGMVKHRATQGHTALIFKTAANDLALLNRSLDQLRERLEAIADIPESDVAYQVALDDIRDTVREIYNPSDGILWVDRWWVWLLGLLLCAPILVTLAEY